nr:6,7-dimethyl-8-ribityllumazine synthase [Bacteroidota bacterium]
MSQHLPSVAITQLTDSLRKNKIAIVTAEWNEHITTKLLEACQARLKEAGISEENIIVSKVPGSFELPLGAQYMLELGQASGVICIGCLIK